MGAVANPFARPSLAISFLARRRRLWPSSSTGRISSASSTSTSSNSATLALTCSTRFRSSSTATRTPCAWMAPGACTGSCAHSLRARFSSSSSYGPLPTEPLPIAVIKEGLQRCEHGIRGGRRLPRVAASLDDCGVLAQRRPATVKVKVEVARAELLAETKLHAQVIRDDASAERRAFQYIKRAQQLAERLH